jgi:hypothetical protein
MAIFTIAAVLASAVGRVANAQSDPKPPCEIWIYNNKSRLPLANPARMTPSLTAPRADPKKEEKLKVEVVGAAAGEAQTIAERMRIKERMQATAAAAPKGYTNSPPAIKIVRSEKSDESRKAMLKRRLSELQAERRWIEEEEHSLRFAVVEIEGNTR